MKLIILTHPEFLESQSMPKFSNFIMDGMKMRGHCVEKWTASPIFYRLPVPSRFKKWLGYIDQFLIFPIQVRNRLKKISGNTLFVFSDQALGPWVPLVSDRPHVIHVHDFMALRSSLGEFPENTVSKTGKIYQKLIQRGFNCGKRFISVSANTEKDLLRFLSTSPEETTVVHNGLNYPFRPISNIEAMSLFSQARIDFPPAGFLLHVGGNMWYKNREGVIAIYQAYAERVESPLPLLMMGAQPTERLLSLSAQGKGDIRFIVNPSTETINAAYSTASALLFPSIIEGFGWPIVEALSCGCPVLTTNRAPMTEVGGDAVTYLPRMDVGNNASEWANNCAELLISVLAQGVTNKCIIRDKALEHAKHFDSSLAMDAYESAYKRAVEAYQS